MWQEFVQSFDVRFLLERCFKGIRAMKKLLRNLIVAGVLISTPPLFPSSIKNPIELGDWLTSNFTYQGEEGKNDYWKSPKETIKDKGGDCEDFAILSKHILDKNGYKTYLIAIRYHGLDYGHIITLIKHPDNTYSHFSNMYYLSKRYKNLRSLLDARFEQYKWSSASYVKNKYFSIPILWNKK